MPTWRKRAVAAYSYVLEEFLYVFTLCILFLQSFLPLNQTLFHFTQVFGASTSIRVWSHPTPMVFVSSFLLGRSACKGGVSGVSGICLLLGTYSQHGRYNSSFFAIKTCRIMITLQHSSLNSLNGDLFFKKMIRHSLTTMLHLKTSGKCWRSFFKTKLMIIEILRRQCEKLEELVIIGGGA